MQEQRENLTADEKQDQMFEAWLAAEGIQFVSPEAEKAYKERVTRVKDAIQLKKLPDRVPIFSILNFFPAYYSGLTPMDVMYDYEKCTAAIRKYVTDFEPDTNPGAFFAGSGRIFELLKVNLYAWPGHGVSPEHSYQCIEGEYMMADEYDALIQDPSHFWNSTYLPRVCGALKPFQMLQSPTSVQEGAFAPFLVPFGLPDVQAAYQTLFEAGAETLKWMHIIGAFDKEMMAAGFPGFLGGISKAPFDVLGDTMRGTKGIMLDIYRQPDKLIKAMEALVPLMIGMGIANARQTGNPLIFIPLHKGADGFISDEQFKKFFWPTLREVILGLIEEGIVPLPALEGYWNTRLEVIQDVPKGKSVWMVDQSDMVKVKNTLGKNACLLGNVPSSMLNLGTPQDVKAYVKNLIDTVGKDGGLIICNGAFFDEAKPENVKAMVDAAKEYGTYK